MQLDDLKKPLRNLTLRALQTIEQSSFGIAGCNGAIALHDSRKDRLIKEVPDFAVAVEALNRSKVIQDSYGGEQAWRIAVQFIYAACAQVDGGVTYEKAFERTWASFAEEMGRTFWSFLAIARLHNIECSSYPVALGPSISIRLLTQSDIAALTGWGNFEFEIYNSDDRWAPSDSVVLVIERRVAKTSSNFLQVGDGSEYQLAVRALLAMRLLAPGEVRMGRMFFACPVAFNVGRGGLGTSGFTHLYPGTPYVLTPSLAAEIAATLDKLQMLEQLSGKAIRSLRLALRSFSSIYDRPLHQAEDGVVDSITALEAIWHLETELSFKLAFRTASVLARSDDERIALFDILRRYYDIRSKVVHGGSLSESQEQQLRDDEPLRGIVRRILLAFVQLAVNPGDWTIQRVVAEADRTLLHEAERRKLQIAMQI